MDILNLVKGATSFRDGQFIASRKVHRVNQQGLTARLKPLTFFLSLNGPIAKLTVDRPSIER